MFFKKKRKTLLFLVRYKKISLSDIHKLKWIKYKFYWAHILSNKLTFVCLILTRLSKQKLKLKFSSLKCKQIV